MVDIGEGNILQLELAIEDIDGGIRISLEPFDASTAEFSWFVVLAFVGAEAIH